MRVIKIALILLFTVSIVSSYGQRSADKKMKAKSGYQVGDVAEDFSLKNVDGNMVSLSSYENVKGYIVVFTSNVCPFALMYEDRLIELHNNMAPKGYPVVAINPNDAEVEAGDSYADMQTKAKESSFPFAYLKDQDQTIYPKYGATKTPHVFILDSDRTVQYIGAIDDNAQSVEDVEVKYVEDAIAALENGDLPSTNFTKAVGCGIKSANASAEGGPRGGRRGPPKPAELLERMDANNDLKISKDEAHGPLAKDFASLDADSDGFITTEELKAMKKGPRGKRPNQ